MKLLDWNIEWMNKWYINGSAVAFRDNNPTEGISDVDTLAIRVAKLITDSSALRDAGWLLVGAFWITIVGGEYPPLKRQADGRGGLRQCILPIARMIRTAKNWLCLRSVLKKSSQQGVTRKENED